MSKKASKKAERLPDPNETAFSIVQALTGETPPAKPAQLTPAKNAAAVELGRLGGAKGGRARAAKLSAKQRSAIAKKAARARWQKR